MLCSSRRSRRWFTIFVVAYLYNLGKSLNALIQRTFCRCRSWPPSACFEQRDGRLAERAFKRGKSAAFKLCGSSPLRSGWNSSERRYLSGRSDLPPPFTISTNLAGTTFLFARGLHASHVLVGLILLSLVFVLSFSTKWDPEQHERLEMIGWYGTS